MFCFRMEGGLLGVEVGDQAGDGAATVADAVLVLGRHLGESAAITLDGLEYAVVAEATSAVALGEDDALDLSLEQVHLIALQQDDGGVETGGAIVDSIEFFQHLVDVGLAVVTRPGIACRVHPRLATQGVNLQPRVVAEAVITVVFLDVTGFDLGITLDIVGSFGNILVTTYVGQTEHLVTVAEHLPQLLQLVGVVGSKNYLLHL